MNKLLSDPEKGLGGIVHCVMVDPGCRLKDNFVTNISNTLYSVGLFM